VLELRRRDCLPGVDPVPEHDVVGDRSRQHARQLCDVADLVRAQELLGGLDGLAVPAELTDVVDDARQRPQQ